ncbi:class II aldolase/adducin family protein [Luteibaculum oceani]|uniref:Class II aldolase/adducin family protein n=2 Tax=Luteibaculum oceani TaxID=1294296 RepID=A0A5C6VL11_9FLAO|nr:class II aldolase/adducin family protein [Luteibaculum oceani]
MMIDEGYIKFDIDWKQSPDKVVKANHPIFHHRDRMFDLGFIGHDTTHDVGFGNISFRESGNQFIISGTQTGHFVRIAPEHFCRVTHYHIAGNKLSCEGPIKASSESLTHAAIYELDPDINAVIHIHNNDMWQHYMDLLPTTKAEIPYGTPEMAREIFRLWRLPDLPQHKILIMAGHEGGIISFGKDFNEASERLEHYYEAMP